MRRVYFYVGKVVHPLYCEQVKAVPPGFEYDLSHPDLADDELVKHDISARGTLRHAAATPLVQAAMLGLGTAGHIRSRNLTPPRGAALVHSAQFLLREPSLPYVVDLEDVHVFSLYQPIALERSWARRRLLELMNHPCCRAVLPWTDAARRNFVATIGPEAAARLGPRVRTVLPSIHPTTDRPRERRGGPLRVLFSGTPFLGKGGPEAVAAVRRLRATHDVELDLVTFLPDDWRKRLGDDGAVRVHTNLPRAALRRLYARADVLLFTPHFDTLGFVVMEAMAAAVVPVASDHFAVPEMVEHGVSGLLFEAENSKYGSDGRARFPRFLPARWPPSFLRALASPSDAYVDRVAGALARVAEDPALYARLSEGALEGVRTGPLSVERRRRELAEVYEGALA